MKLLLLIISTACLHAATNPPVAPVPVPSSPYLPRIYRYVDTLLEDSKQTANLHHHQNFLRLLYTLTDLSTKPKYRDAADAALRIWLDNVPSSDDKITRPWMLWNRCFEIAREPSTRFALAMVKNQTTNHPGFYLRACSAAYAHTTNAVFLQAIETLLKPFENSKPPRPCPSPSTAMVARRYCRNRLPPDCEHSPSVRILLRTPKPRRKPV